MRPMADARHPYIDRDTTDEFLDYPDRIHYSDGTMSPTGKELDNLRDPEWRKEHGLGPLPPLPPLVEH